MTKYIDPPRTSRAKRSADAAAEVSALAPQTPKGIDARSLAAAPTQGFTITRVDPTPNKSARSRGSGDRPGTNASRSRIVARGAGAAGSRGRGGAFRGRGRGGAQGGVPRANKPAARGKKRRGPAVKRDREEDYDEPLNSEELAYLNSVEQGVKSPFVPTTTLGALDKQGPAVATSTGPRGLTESVIYQLQLLTDGFPRDAPVHPRTRLAEYNGKGVLFESIEEKKRLEDMGRKFDTLSEAEKSAILNALVAGRYAIPKLAGKGDLAGQVDEVLTHNETYLLADKTRLLEKVKSLLPSQKPPASKGKQPAPKAKQTAKPTAKRV